MTPTTQKIATSCMAALFFSGFLLVMYQSGFSIALFLGSIIGVILAIGGCFAFHQDVYRNTLFPAQPGTGGKSIISIGIILGTVLPSLARLLGIPYSIAVFVVSMGSLGLTIFFLWLGWMFVPPAQTHHHTTDGDRWRPRDPAARDDECWRS
jgi:hypothetical protein